MKRITSLLLALTLLLSLAACGSKEVSGDDSGSAKEASYTDAGTYEIFSITDGDNTISRDTLVNAGLPVTLTLEDGGKGVLDYGDGDSASLTWSDRSITLDGEALSYHTDDGLLVMDLSDSSGVYILTFQAASAETVSAPAGPDAAASGKEKGKSAEGKTGNDEAKPSESPAPSASSAPSEAPSQAPSAVTELPVSADLGSYHVAVVGAEQFQDDNGGDAVRFYYEFTNHSDVPAAAFGPLYFAAAEDGKELETVFTSGDSDLPEYWNEMLQVEPGVTIRCVEQYSFDPAGTALTFNISQLTDDGFTVTLDPGNLPGPPSEPWSISPISDPQFFMQYDAQGADDNASVTITGAELTESGSVLNEGDVVRYYFEITNQTDAPASLTSLLSITAYQDGVELEYCFPADQNDSDRAYSEDLPAGETVTVSRTWLLRSGNPVEVAVTPWLSDDVICAGTLDLNQ